MMRTLLVSADLTADENSATGGHRRFVPRAPAPGDFSRGCRPAYADNDPLDHCPGASALLDLNSGKCLNEKTAWFPLIRGKRGSLAWCRCASGPADESPMTACGGNFIGDEIRRNEQCPHEADLRRLSLRRTPPTRMLCIRGKPGNNPQGKVNFSPGIFPAFLGQKPSNFS